MTLHSADAQAPGESARGFLFELVAEPQGLTLYARHRPSYGGVCADWCGEDLRRRIAGGKKQLLARAVGLPKKPALHVLDATGGLGRDACTLAALGAHVTLCERQPEIHALLADAQRRAAADPRLAAAAARVELLSGDAATLLASGRRWDAIYLDPMYPDDGKTALPGREMQIFRDLTGGDADADALLEAALRAAPRVAVKRPVKAPPLAGRKPNSALSSTQVRFDLYLSGTAAPDRFGTP